MPRLKIYSLLLLFTWLLTLSSCRKDTPLIDSSQSEETSLSEESSSPEETQAQTTSKEEIVTSAQHYIFPNSDKEIIKEDSLLFMDAFTKRLAKNEIFARKGYVFKDEDLNNYFSNMPWYLPDKEVKGTMDELNSIEKQNVTTIDNRLEKETSFLDVSELSNNNGKKFYTQKITRDLNYDGHDENITINYILNNYDLCDSIEIIIQDYQGKESKHLNEGTSFNKAIMFADFNINDNLLQFYFDDEGPSDDPTTNIFSFDGNQIITNIKYLIGHVDSYDGLGKILSYKEYNVNSYYDLNKGFTPYPKENIIGKELKYNINLVLFDKPFTERTAAIISDYYTQVDLKEYLSHQDNFISLVKANTKLEVLDIEFEPNEGNGYSYHTVPWLKIKTEDNVIGWFSIAYGD